MSNFVVSLPEKTYNSILELTSKSIKKNDELNENQMVLAFLAGEITVGLSDVTLIPHIIKEIRKSDPGIEDVGLLKSDYLTSITWLSELPSTYSPLGMLISRWTNLDFTPSSKLAHLSYQKNMNKYFTLIVNPLMALGSKFDKKDTIRAVRLSDISKGEKSKVEDVELRMEF